MARLGIVVRRRLGHVGRSGGVQSLEVNLPTVNDANGGLRLRVGMAREAGDSALAVRLRHGNGPTMAAIHPRVVSVHVAAMHVAIRAGHVTHELLIGHADAAGALQDVVATVVGVGKAQVAMAMAKRGRKVLDVDICVADTGIAGPGGATPGKPVGLFYLGLSHQDDTFSQKHLFKGTREENIQQAAQAVLMWVREYLESLKRE